MPKTYELGSQHFAQVFRLPAKWNGKFVVRGTTQEIDFPYRFSTPYMIRLPFNHVLVLGKWSGTTNESDVTIRAVQGRVLQDEDFLEGWTPPPKQDRKESI